VRTDVEIDPAYLQQPSEDILRRFADFDYLWFPVSDPQFDLAIKNLLGEELKDRVFRVKRSDGKITFVPLDGVFK
jgi:hypothetical protein